MRRMPRLGQAFALRHIVVEAFNYAELVQVRLQYVLCQCVLFLMILVIVFIYRNIM